MTPPGHGHGFAGAITIDWTEARDALADQVGRVTALLRSVRHPEAAALGHWSLAEVAMHLSQAWILVPGLAADDLSHVHRRLLHLEGKAGPSLIKDMLTRLDPHRAPARWATSVPCPRHLEDSPDADTSFWVALQMGRDRRHLGSAEAVERVFANSLSGQLHGGEHQAHERGVAGCHPEEQRP